MSLLRSYLEANAILSPADLEGATRHQQSQGGSLDTALLELGLLSAADLDTHLGKACGLPTVPARLLETGPERPWGQVPRALLDIGWAMPLAVEDGNVLVAVHPDLPDARLGQLYRQIRGFMPMVAPECCLAKLAAERSGGIVAPRHAMLVLDVMDALQARDTAAQDSPRDPVPHDTLIGFPRPQMTPDPPATPLAQPAPSPAPSPAPPAASATPHAPSAPSPAASATPHTPLPQLDHLPVLEDSPADSAAATVMLPIATFDAADSLSATVILPTPDESVGSTVIRPAQDDPDASGNYPLAESGRFPAHDSGDFPTAGTSNRRSGAAPTARRERDASGPVPTDSPARRTSAPVSTARDPSAPVPADSSASAPVATDSPARDPSAPLPADSPARSMISAPIPADVRTHASSAAARAAAPAPSDSPRTTEAADEPLHPGTSLSMPVLHDPGRAERLARRMAPARAALAGARERDRITEALVQGAIQIAPRVALFGVKREGLRALAAPGSMLQLSTSLIIPVPEGSLLDRAVLGQIRLKLLTEPKLAAAVGRPLGIPCLFEPVYAQERGVLMLYIDRDGGLFDAADHTAARELCDLARGSLETLLRMRNLGAARPGGAALDSSLTHVQPSGPSPAATPQDPSGDRSEPTARAASEPAAPVPEDSHGTTRRPDSTALTEATASRRPDSTALTEASHLATASEASSAPEARDTDADQPGRAASSPTAIAADAPVPEDSRTEPHHQPEADTGSGSAPEPHAVEAPRSAPSPSARPRTDSAPVPEASRSTASAPVPEDSRSATTADRSAASEDSEVDVPSRSGTRYTMRGDGPRGRESGRAQARGSADRRDTAHRDAAPDGRRADADAPVRSRATLRPDLRAAADADSDPSAESSTSRARPEPDAPGASEHDDAYYESEPTRPIQSGRGLPGANRDRPLRSKRQVIALVNPIRRDSGPSSAADPAVARLYTARPLTASRPPEPPHSTSAPVPEDSAAIEDPTADPPSADSHPASPIASSEPAHTPDDRVTDERPAEPAPESADADAPVPEDSSPTASTSGLHLPNLVAPPGTRRAVGKKGDRTRAGIEPALNIPSDLRRPAAPPRDPATTLSIPTSLIAPTPLPGAKRRGSKTGQNPVPPRADEITLNMPRLVRADAPATAAPDDDDDDDLSPETASSGADATDPAHERADSEPTDLSPETDPDDAAELEQDDTDEPGDRSRHATAAAPSSADADAPLTSAGEAEPSARHLSSGTAPDSADLVDADAAIEHYLHDPDADDALSPLLAAGRDGLLRLAARFPGPIDPGNNHSDVRAAFPPPSSHGPLLRACVELGEAISPYILELVENPRPQIRFYAAFLFQDLRDPRCMRPLAAHAFDPDPDVRLIATRVLESYSRSPGFAEATERVRAALLGRDRERALLAAEAAGTLRDTLAVPTLIELLSVRDKQLRETALESLCSITAKHHGYRPAKWKSWYAEHGKQTRIEWVIDALRHRDTAVRRWAADELVRITGHRLAPPPPGEKVTARHILSGWLDWFDAHGADYS